LRGFKTASFKSVPSMKNQNQKMFRWNMRKNGWDSVAHTSRAEEIHDWMMD